MWVVKLGGSLLGTPELASWLDVLAQQSDGRILIVPGGGLFADTVRAAQPGSGYDDATAHHMALLAMEQYGLVMQSLQPELVTAASELEIAERSWQHRATVWMPSRMVLADEAIPKSWQVTSDSIAAWLAAKIGADRLVLVKYTQPAGQLSVDLLAETGVVDSAFPRYVGHLNCPVEVMGKADHAVFSAKFASASLASRAS